jgi:hypothetical protein
MWVLYHKTAAGVLGTVFGCEGKQGRESESFRVSAGKRKCLLYSSDLYLGFASLYARPHASR